MKLNPEPGEIPNVKFEIGTVENRIINPSQYSAPIKYEKQVAGHIKQLGDRGTIRESNST